MITSQHLRIPRSPTESLIDFSDSAYWGTSVPKSAGHRVWGGRVGAITSFEQLATALYRAEARELLRTAPTSTRAARLTRALLAAALRRSGGPAASA